MNKNQRITLEDTPFSMLEKLAEGNPGAMSVVLQLFEKGASIDPASFLGPLGGPILLDSFGVYGSRIWMLYKDVCKQNLVDTLGILRGAQLGFLSQNELDTAIDNYGQGIDVQEVLGKVRERIPEFQQ